MQRYLLDSFVFTLALTGLRAIPFFLRFAVFQSLSLSSPIALHAQAATSDEIARWERRGQSPGRAPPASSDLEGHIEREYQPGR